jgi:3-oxoadipate enol-lactonase
MPEVKFNGAVLHYELEGSLTGPPLVLIHAGVATLRMWDAVVPALGADHRILRYDTRGFGLTSTEDVSFSDVDDLLAVMDDAGVARATLVGASRGGRIAIDAAVEHPERVAGLVTVGSNPSGFPDVELTERENDLFDVLDGLLAAGDLERLNRLEAELWAAGPTRDVLELDPAFLETAYALNAANVRHAGDAPRAVPIEPPAYERTVDIEAPSLFIVGEHDLSTELAATEYLLSTVPESSGATFPDTAHLPSVERPSEFVRVLGGWLGAHGL